MDDSSGRTGSAECIADSCRSPGTGSSDDGYDRNSKKLV